MSTENSLTVQVPDSAPVRERMVPVLQEVKKLVVHDRDSHAVAQGLFAGLKGMERQVRDLFQDSKQAAHAAHRSIVATEAKLLKPIEEGKHILANKVSEYAERVRQEVEAEERRLQAAARKQQEEEALELATALADEGDTEAAEAVLKEAAEAEAPVVHVEPQIAKTEGVTAATLYSAECHSVAELLAHIWNRPEFHGLVKIDKASLNRLARTMRENFRIPGCKLVKKQSMRVRRGD